MKILFLADEESKMYWEYFKKEDFKGIDIIVSCGDLNPSYLSFLTTMVESLFVCAWQSTMTNTM